MQNSGFARGASRLVHLATGGVIYTPLPARSPSLNAYAERWVRSVKEMFVEVDPVWRAVPAA
jgi:hypothetical protein